MEKTVIDSILNYSKAMGAHCPFNCGNLLVSAQYAIPLQMILKYVKPSAKILDWGCGMGHFSYLLMQEGFDVESYAYETEDNLGNIKKIIETVLNQHWKLHHSASDPVRLPFAEGTFEAVISIGVLEHVRETGGNKIDSLKEIHRILKPGGYFLCFHFPNRYSWIEAASRTLNNLQIKKYYHQHLYTKKDICKLTKEISYKLCETKKYNLFPYRMFSKLPDALAWNRFILSTYHALEKMCSLPFGIFSQNHYFVLQK